MADLEDEAQAILELLRADLLASVGLTLEARVRSISPEELRARDLDLDARFSEPGAKVVLLGSTLPGPRARALGAYATHWELEMPHTRSMIHDAVDVIDVVQEEVIEDLWRQGRSASWPECPEHGGHPLDCAIDDGNLLWRCPSDPSVAIPLGGLGHDGRFASTSVRTATDVQSLLLDLLRKYVCPDAGADGDDLVAEGNATVDGLRRAIALRIRADAMDGSLRHHGEPVAAAGAVLTDAEEQLHFAALD